MKHVKNLNLKVGYLHNLRNDEFYQLVKDVVEFGEGFTFDEAMIKQQYKQLQDDLEVLSKVTSATTYHENTVYIRENYMHMRRFMVGLKKSIDTFQNYGDSEMRLHAHKLNSWIHGLRDLMVSQAQAKLQTAAKILIAGYEQDGTIRVALDEFGLSVFYREIKRLSNELVEMEWERTGDRADLKQMRQNLRERVTFNLEMFFRLLQAAVNLNGAHASDYYAVCLLMEKAMTAILAVQKTRATKSRNRRMEGEDEITEPDVTMELTENEDSTETTITVGDGGVTTPINKVPQLLYLPPPTDADRPTDSD